MEKKKQFYTMYSGAKPVHFRMAKELRKNQTPAEEALWKVLSGNTLKVSRQVPFNFYGRAANQF